MLDEQRWRTLALVRLFASLLISMFFVGGLARSVLIFFEQSIHSGVAPLLSAALAGVISFGGMIILLQRPWPMNGVPKRLVLFAFFFYAGFAALWLTSWLAGEPLAGAGQTTGDILIAVLSFQGIALLLVHRFLREHGIGWSQGFGFRNHRWRAVGLGAVVAFLAMPAGAGLQIVSAYFLQRLNVAPAEQQAVEVLRSSVAVPSRIVLGLVTIILVPIAEEVLFRGLLYRWVKQLGFPRIAIWSTAVLFGAIHLNLAIFLPLTVLALALTWLYERTENLLASITAHSIFNALNFVMLYALDTFPHANGPK